MVVWIFRTDVMAFLRKPLDEAMRTLPPDKVRVIQTSAGEGFVTYMKIAFFGGCVLTGPLILQQIWGFVAAGLYPHERRVVRFYAVPGFVLFFAGAALAYLVVMPWALDFLLGFALDEAGIDESLLTVSSYVTLMAWGMFIFGLAFQLPIIMVFLMRLGVVEPSTFRRWRRPAVVIIFCIAAVLTPPDVVSQCVLAGCMMVLYEGAIFVGSRVARPRKESA